LAKLVIKYLKRCKFPLPSPVNLQTKIENKLVKITWDKIEDEDLVGYYVVRNRWHEPKNPFDGVKLYAGSDKTIPLTTLALLRLTNIMLSLVMIMYLTLVCLLRLSIRDNLNFILRCGLSVGFCHAK